MEEKVTRERVVVDQPETMNLLGLLMRGLLAANLQDDDAYARALGIGGDVLVGAGGMQVTLRFDGAGISIIRGDAGAPRARVSGGMKALLEVVTEGKMVGPLLAGKIAIGGNPFLLLTMLPLIRAK